MKKLTQRYLKPVLLLLAFVASLGLATNGYGQAVVTVEAVAGDTLTVGEQVEINVNIAGGADVAEYAVVIAFDAAVLRYISATRGNYLPPGGVWMAPKLSADGSYEVTLSIDDEISSGKSVLFAEDEITIDSMFSELPPPPPEAEVAIAQVTNPWRVSILASADPGGASAPDGTLVTFTFEVLKSESTPLLLLDTRLYDAEDATLAVTAQSTPLTLNASDAPVDVNGDGDVNILDLVFVAGHFGVPVTEANQAADVNGDGAINILDLTRIAQNFGQ